MSDYYTVEKLAEERGWPVYSPRQLVELLTEMLMVRKGEVIDESVARERAKNIATALSQSVVK